MRRRFLSARLSREARRGRQRGFNETILESVYVLLVFCTVRNASCSLQTAMRNRTAPKSRMQDNESNTLPEATTWVKLRLRGGAVGDKSVTPVYMGEGRFGR